MDLGGFAGSRNEKVMSGSRGLMDNSHDMNYTNRERTWDKDGRRMRWGDGRSESSFGEKTKKIRSKDKDLGWANHRANPALWSESHYGVNDALASTKPRVWPHFEVNWGIFGGGEGGRRREEREGKDVLYYCARSMSYRTYLGILYIHTYNNT